MMRNDEVNFKNSVTVAKFATVQNEGGRNVERFIQKSWTVYDLGRNYIGGYYEV